MLRPSGHSFSSGFWGSKIWTWVKGKSPCRPFTSPSHWPLMFILVTFTTSPTCWKKTQQISIHCIIKFCVNLIHFYIWYRLSVKTKMGTKGDCMLHRHYPLWSTQISVQIPTIFFYIQAKLLVNSRQIILSAQIMLFWTSLFLVL